MICTQILKCENHFCQQHADNMHIKKKKKKIGNVCVSFNPMPKILDHQDCASIISNKKTKHM